MARRVSSDPPKRPSQRISDELSSAVFFPGEVAELLGFAGVDYRQLRQIFEISRRTRGEDFGSQKWARFTLRDLAAAEVLVSLGGGREALLPGRRLVLRPIEKAGLALRDLGFDDPLMQVPLARDGRRILAKVEGMVLEPTTGQLALDDACQRLDLFVERHLIEDREVRRRIRQERLRLRIPRARRITIGHAISQVS